MKTLQILISIGLSIAVSVALFQMFYYDSSRGAELYGALSGYVAVMTFCVWLFYVNVRPDKDKVLKDKLQNLKKDGLLTDVEYDDKISQMKEQDAVKGLKENPSYRKIKSLYKSGILTKEEFEQKQKIIIDGLIRDNK